MLEPPGWIHLSVYRFELLFLHNFEVVSVANYKHVFFVTAIIFSHHDYSVLQVACLGLSR